MHVKAKTVVMGSESVHELVLGQSPDLGGSAKMAGEVSADFFFGIPEERSVPRRQRDVVKVVEFGKNARAAEFRDAGEKEKPQGTGIAFERREELAHLGANLRKKLCVVHASRQGRIVLVDQKDKRKLRKIRKPVSKIREASRHVFRPKSQGRELRKDERMKLLCKVVDVRKFLDV